jgi:glycosyltransferase involved in cell wall biosynthesis
MTQARPNPKVRKRHDLYLVTQYADDSVNSTGYLWALFIRSARQAGYRVHLITPRADLPGWMPSALAKLTVTLSLLLICLWRLPRHSTALFATNPAFLPLAASIVRRLKRVRVFVLIHDLFPQNTLPVGLMQAQSLNYRILSTLFRKAYRRCAGLIVIGRDMEEVLIGLLGRDVPLLYVPIWVPAVATPKHLLESPPSQLCHFQYFGNLGALQGLDAVLDGIANSRSANARFDFVGTGAARVAISAHPVLSQDTRVTLHPPVAFAERGHVLGACDVSLVTLLPQMYGLAVPSKAYFSMAYGVPFLYVGDPGSELHLTIQDEPGIGWFVPAGDSNAMAQKIDQICETFSPQKMLDQHAIFINTLHPDTAALKIMKFLQE